MDGSSVCVCAHVCKCVCVWGVYMDECVCNTVYAMWIVHLCVCVCVHAEVAEACKKCRRQCIEA